MTAADLSSITTLVDLELKRLEDSRREHGWTPWILLAALAALCWQLTDYLSQPRPWERVGLYWALLVVVGLTLESVIAGLNSGEGPRRPGLRYFRSHLYSAGRSARLFAALKIGGAAILFWQLVPLTGPVMVGWIVLFGLYVYALVGHVAGSWWEFFHPVGTLPAKSKHAWIFPVAVWILHLGLVISAVWQVWPRLLGTYNAADARLALLAFAAVHLVTLLLGFGVNEPLRRELIHLRRQIGFGELEAAQARQQLFELIYGSELSVLLRSRFEEVEKALDHFPSLHAEALDAVLAASEGPDRTAAAALVKQVDDRFDAIQNAWLALQMRLMVCRWSGGIPQDVATREAALKARFEATEKQATAIKSGWKSLPSARE